MSGPDEVVVDASPASLAKLTEWRSAGGQRIGVIERDVTLVRPPFDAQLDRLARGQRQLEVVVPGIPVLPPALEHFCSVGINLNIT